MTKELWVDPGHRLSDEDFAAVVRRAKEVRAEVEQAAAGGAAGPGGIVVDMTAAGIRSKKYFPVSGIPTQLLVLHSAECPLRAGYAVSLTEWFQATIYPQAPVASWQRFVDPVHRVRAVPDELGAWHASEANPLSIGWEQAGYARYSRAEWLTPDGLAQLELLAFDMAEVAVRDGIPARWLTTAEVRAVLDGGDRSIKGFCLHRQIDPETRTDPGDNYPYELLMERIRAYMDPSYIPAITQEETLAQLSDEQAARLNAAVDRILGRDEQRYLFQDTDGRIKPCAADTPGAWAARSADVGDVLGLLYQGQDATKRTVDEISSAYHQTEASAERRAKDLAALVGTLSAQELAGAIPDNIAQEVADELGRRLQGGAA